VPQDPCPNQLLPIARAWTLSHGGEFGFSMGRFCPSYVARQRVFLVKCDAQSVGFITFHVTKNDWALDLIRHSENIPDGAIHAAIVTAIEVAKNEGVRQLSLASVPDPRFTPKFWANSRAGLTQFKRSFAPTWAPRYLAAPNSWFFWISGAMIGLAIHRPLANAPWKLAATLKFIMQKYQLGFMRSRLHR
jgi:phosphatidylglycerol lysyltransferase